MVGQDLVKLRCCRLGVLYRELFSHLERISPDCQLCYGVSVSAGRRHIITGESYVNIVQVVTPCRVHEIYVF